LFNFSEKVINLLDEHGIQVGFWIFVAAIAVCSLVLAIPTFTLGTNGVFPFIDKLMPCVGLSLFVVFFVCLVVAVSVGYDLLKGSGVHVIAWDGYEEASIYAPGKKRSKPQFLTYLRPIDDLPPLDLRNGVRCEFDGLVIDIELLSRFRKMRTPQNNDILHSIDQKHLNAAIHRNEGTKTPLHDVAHQLITGIAVDGQAIYGVPLRMGFQEILCRQDVLQRLIGAERFAKVKAVKRDAAVKIYSPAASETTADDFSHADFNVDVLISTGLRVGLWHWYLPTLTTLALTLESNPKDTDFLDGADAQAAIERLGTHDSVHLLYSSEQIQRSLTSDAEKDRPVDIVLGAGSWALREDTEQGKVAIVVPVDKLPVFIDCCSLLNERSQDNPRHFRRQQCIKWLLHMLTDRAQLELCSKAQYQAIPVTKPALDRMLANSSKPWIAEVWNAIAPTAGAFPKPPLLLRSLPTEQHSWYWAWGQIESKFK